MRQYRRLTSMNDSGEFQEVESNYSGRLSDVSSQPAMIPSSRSLLSRDKRLPLDTWNILGLQGNVFGNSKFLRMIHPVILFKEFTLAHHKENQGQFHRPQGRGLFSKDMTNKIEAQFQCRHLQEGRRLRVRQYRWDFRRLLWLGSRYSKYRCCISTNSPIHNLFVCGNFDSKIKRLLVLIFDRKQCYGSWRCLIHWRN